MVKSMAARLPMLFIEEAARKIKLFAAGHFPPVNTDSGATIVHYDRNVFLPAAGNAGFDVVLLRKAKKSSGYVAVCIECRFSVPLWHENGG